MTSAWLRSVNPLAKLLAMLAPIVWVFLAEDITVPIVWGAIAAVLLLTGIHPTPRQLLPFVLGLPVAVAVLSLLFAVWVDPALARTSTWTDDVTLFPGVFGPVTLSSALAGAKTALRIAAIALLSVLASAGSTRTGLTDALMQNARLPYRIGYTAYAATGFVPRLAEQRRIILAAHRVRGGARARGIRAWFRRTTSTAVALLIDALRHSERMALAMESRAFGAYRTRTWRRVVPWRGRDTCYVAVMIMATVVGAVWTAF